MNNGGIKWAARKQLSTTSSQTNPAGYHKYYLLWYFIEFLNVAFLMLHVTIFPHYIYIFNVVWRRQNQWLWLVVSFNGNRKPFGACLYTLWTVSSIQVKNEIARSFSYFWWYMGAWRRRIMNNLSPPRDMRCRKTSKKCLRQISFLVILSTVHNTGQSTNYWWNNQMLNLEDS
jgi:hypothetical protein